MPLPRLAIVRGAAARAFRIFLRFPTTRQKQECVLVRTGHKAMGKCSSPFPYTQARLVLLIAIGKTQPALE